MCGAAQAEPRQSAQTIDGEASHLPTGSRSTIKHLACDDHGQVRGLNTQGFSRPTLLPALRKPRREHGLQP